MLKTHPKEINMTIETVTFDRSVLASLPADMRLALFDATLRSDFYTFVQAAFPIVAGGNILQRNWHLEAMTAALSDVINGIDRRLIITVPPRSLKSICSSVALPAFVLGQDPSRRIICVNLM